jgi:hypothetical protein
MSELASCVAERNAGSASSAGTAGALEVSAEATRRRKTCWSFGVVSLTASAAHPVVGSERT